MSKIFDIKKTAEILEVSERTVNKWIYNGRIKTESIERITSDELIRFIKASNVTEDTESKFINRILK